MPPPSSYTAGSAAPGPGDASGADPKASPEELLSEGSPPEEVPERPVRLRSGPARERLYDLLAEGHVLTTAEATARLGVSGRSVRRAVRQLRRLGVPVAERTRAGTREKAFYVPEAERPVPGAPVPLTERELLALVVAAEASRAQLAPTPLAGPLREAFARLLPRLAPQDAATFELRAEPRRWDFGEAPGQAPAVDLDPEVFYALRRAIAERRPVAIDYHTASTGRRWTGRHVDPLVIAPRSGSWLVAAYCHEREAVRDFNLAAISRLRVIEGETFAEPAGFDPGEHFAGRFGALAGKKGGVPERVRLRVEPGRAHYFRRKRYHPSQQIEREESDGRLVVTYEVEELETVAAFVRSWGPGVTVLGPERLRERIGREARATLARYDDAPRYDDATDGDTASRDTTRRTGGER